MKKLTALALLLISAFSSAAQTDSVKADPVFLIADTMPSFPGGEGQMMLFIAKNIVFPQAEKEKGMSGTCYVTFVVEKDGSITNAKILKGVTDGPGFGVESINVINKMPKWLPGKQNGMPVRVQYNLPVKFRSLAKSPEELAKDANVHYNKGMALAKQDQFELALKEFEETLKILPGDQDALYNKGYMLFKLDKKDEACIIWNTIKKSGNIIANEAIEKNCD